MVRARKLGVKTFRVICRRREMYIGHARLCLSESVCLSVRRCMPTLLHGPGCSFDEWQGSPLVVHYWAGLQSVHGFRRYDNIALNAKSASAYTRFMPGCINGCGRERRGRGKVDFTCTRWYVAGAAFLTLNSKKFRRHLLQEFWKTACTYVGMCIMYLHGTEMPTNCDQDDNE